MTTNEYLKTFGQGLAEEHIKKLKQENGVRDVISILKQELEQAMKYCGITDVENIDPNLLSYNFS